MNWCIVPQVDVVVERVNVGRVLLVGGTSWWYRWILTADPLRFFKRSCEGFHLPRQTVDGGSTPGVVTSSVVDVRPPLKCLPWCRDRRRFGRPLPPNQQCRPGICPWPCPSSSSVFPRTLGPRQPWRSQGSSYPQPAGWRGLRGSWRARVWKSKQLAAFKPIILL